VQKVLVTGSDGYIGSVLVPALVAGGYEVRGLDAFYYEDCLFGKRKPAVETIRKDVRDVTAGDLRGFDAIIHLAALSNDPLGALDVGLTLEINCRASTRLAELAKAAGVPRFLYASSCSLYGKSHEEWVDEASLMAPTTAYARSKVMTEEFLHTVADDCFSPVILRCATVFGLAPKLRVDLVVNNLTGWGVTTQEIRLLSDGTPWRPLIHVEDLARAYEFFLRAPAAQVHDRAFNVGFCALNYRVRDIAEAVGRSLPGTRIAIAKEPDRDARSYRVRFDRFVALSGLAPLWDLESGVADILKGYRDKGLTREEFLGRKYVRLNQLRYLLDTNRIDAQLRWSR
jgi:nucleoside-diphosphate-sugar epimerase